MIYKITIFSHHHHPHHHHRQHDLPEHLVGGGHPDHPPADDQRRPGRLHHPPVPEGRGRGRGGWDLGAGASMTAAVPRAAAPPHCTARRITAILDCREGGEGGGSGARQQPGQEKPVRHLTWNLSNQSIDWSFKHRKLLWTKKYQFDIQKFCDEQDACELVGVKGFPNLECE